MPPEETIRISEDDLEKNHIVLDEEDLIDLPNCTYCQDEIENINQGVYCEKCEAAYHSDCWNEINKCVVLGCSSRSIKHESTINDSNDHVELGRNSLPLTDDYQQGARTRQNNYSLDSLRDLLSSLIDDDND